MTPRKLTFTVDAPLPTYRTALRAQRWPHRAAICPAIHPTHPRFNLEAQQQAVSTRRCPHGTPDVRAGSRLVEADIVVAMVTGGASTAPVFARSPPTRPAVAASS